MSVEDEVGYRDCVALAYRCGWTKTEGGPSVAEFLAEHLELGPPSVVQQLIIDGVWAALDEVVPTWRTEESKRTGVVPIGDDAKAICKLDERVNHPCNSKGHKIGPPIFRNKQYIAGKENDPVVLNQETYLGHICVRCGTKFHAEEG